MFPVFEASTRTILIFNQLPPPRNGLGTSRGNGERKFGMLRRKLRKEPCYVFSWIFSLDGIDYIKPLSLSLSSWMYLVGRIRLRVSVC